MLVIYRTKNLWFRLLALLIGFGVGIIPSQLSTHTPKQSQQKTSEIVFREPTPDRDGEVLSLVLPGGTWVDSTELDKFPRAELIKVLKRAEINASGDRALGIAFLLAMLNEDYVMNTNLLLNGLSRCRQKPYPEAAACADYLSSYLMELSRRGDTTLLGPIFEVSDLADGAFAESLGGFYSDMLNMQPNRFLEALSHYSREHQNLVCELAGDEDGGGTEHRRFQRVQRVLNSKMKHPSPPIAMTARICLRCLEASYKEALRNRNTNPID